MRFNGDVINGLDCQNDLKHEHAYYTYQNISPNEIQLYTGKENNVKLLIHNPCMMPSVELTKLDRFVFENDTEQRFKCYEESFDVSVVFGYITDKIKNNIYGLFGRKDELFSYISKFEDTL